MMLYHEVKVDLVESIQKDGLKRDTSGDKTNEIITRVDELLDSARPDYIKDAGLSRQNNLYAYIGDASTIIDIRTGKRISLKNYLQNDNTKLLRLQVDRSSCYVADLDCYDAIKSAVETGETPDKQALTAYWQNFIPIEKFEAGHISRPEVMITRDVRPNEIVPL